jgi:hypothetical protein
LIVTDGEIADVDTSLELLKDAESLPMSVLSVGMGNSDQKALEELKRLH